MVILAADVSVVRSTYHRTTGKIPGQLLFGRDMILPIKHIADCKYIRHIKQAQIEKDVIRKKSTTIDHNYRVGDRVMVKKHTYFKC